MGNNKQYSTKNCFGTYDPSICTTKCVDITECTLTTKNVPTEAPKRDAEEAKPDMSYLPMDLLEKVANAYQFGGIKGYPRNSWRKGFSVSRLVAASRRHDADFWDKGETFDKQAKEEYNTEVYHCAMVIFNQLCILDTLLNHPGLDDRLIKEIEPK